MFYKKQGFPEENEIVICTIKKVLPNSVFVDLDEYVNKEGLIHISEISPGRIRNIRDFVREGKKIVCKVLSIKKERNQIDLSLRRVNQAQRINKNNEYKQEQRAEKILEIIGSQNKKDLKQIYEEIGNKIIEEFGSLNACFQELIKEESILDSLNINPKLKKQLIEVVKEKIKPKEIKVSRILKLKSTLSNGIIAIKETLKKISEIDKGDKENEIKCDILYAGAPNYRITLTAQNYKDAEKNMEKIIEIAESSFKGKGTIEILKNEKRNT